MSTTQLPSPSSTPSKNNRPAPPPQEDATKTQPSVPLHGGFPLVQDEVEELDIGMDDYSDETPSEKPSEAVEGPPVQKQQTGTVLPSDNNLAGRGANPAISNNGLQSDTKGDRVEVPNRLKNQVLGRPHTLKPNTTLLVMSTQGKKSLPFHLRVH
jgi:hypothetical protein